MKIKWVATQNARKFKTGARYIINRCSVLFISMFLLVISCSKNDDMEIVKNESPIDSQTPDKNQTVDDSKSVIIYTDLEPDFAGDNLSVYYDLDLNNDGIVDYTLSLWNDTLYDYLLIQSSPTATNTFISVTPWYGNVEPLDKGKKIFTFPLEGYNWGESYLNWAVFTIGNCFGGEESCFYDWKDKNDKYLGLHFYINGQSHYGWACLDVTSVTQWVIKDYAYNATPNQPILAGQKE